MLDEHKKWLSSSSLGFLSGTELSIVAVTGDSSGMMFETQVYCGPKPAPPLEKYITIRQQPRQSAFDWASDVDEALRRMGCPVVGKRAKLDDLQGAKLPGVDLRFADLRKVSIEDADLEGIQLTGTNLEHGYIINNVRLNLAIMYGADMRNIKVWDSNLTGADLRHADLSNSEFRRANLSGAQLDFANLRDVLFEPADISGASVFGAQGLDSLRFGRSTAAVQLRKACKDAGLRREERALTSSIKKNELKTETSSSALFEQYLLGGKLTNYGVQPWRAIAALLAFIPAFALLYAFALARKEGPGIWVVHYVDGPIEKNQRAVPVRPRARRKRRLDGEMKSNESDREPGGTTVRLLKKSFANCRKVLFCLRVGFYFSCLGAFQIGWKDFNIGAWLARLQSRPYTLRATGWVRTVSGLQALLGLYLFVIWALTYFGNPFE